MKSKTAFGLQCGTISGLLLVCISAVCWAQIPERLPQTGRTPPAANRNPELEIQLGHSGRINAAAFSKDGRLLVSGGDDPIAIVWDVTTGRVLRRLIGNVNPVRAVAFSPDGRFILTGTGHADEHYDARIKREKTLRLWDMSTGKDVNRFISAATAMSSVQFSPDGRLVLTVSEDGAAMLWNAATGTMIGRLFEHGAGPVSAATFSPDGRFVLTGEGYSDADCCTREHFTVRLWSVVTRAVVQRFSSKQAVGSLSFSPDGHFFLSSGEGPRNADHWGDNAEVHLWNLKTREERKFKAVAPVTFSPDSKYILSGGDPQKAAEGAALLEVNSGKIIHVLCGRQPVLTNPHSAVNRNSKCDEEVGGVDGVAFSRDGHQALVVSNPISTGGNGGFTSGTSALTLYDVESGKEIRKFQGDAEAPTQISFLNHERMLTTGSALWNSITGQQVGIEQRSAPDIAKLFIDSVSADGRFALTTNSLKKSFVMGQIGGDLRDDPEPLTIRLWDLASGKEVTRFPKSSSEDREELNPQAWLSADGRYVLAMEEQPHKDAAETLGMKDTESMLQELAAAARSGDSTKANKILKATADATVSRFTAHVWETSTGKELWHYDFGAPDYSHVGSSYYADTPSNYDWIFSPDGHYVMLRGNKRTVLLSAADGTIVKEFDNAPLEAGVPLLAISPDNRFFASDEGDVIEISTKKRVWSLSSKHAPSFIKSLLFSPNSQLLLISGEIEREGKDAVKQLTLINVRSGGEIMHLDGQMDFPYAFSSDSRFLLTADASTHVANLWDLKTKTRKQRFEGHLADIESVAFSSDGRFVLTGSSDSTTRVWDSASGRELGRLISFSGGDWAVVTPEGLFDGSPGAWKKMLWRFNNNTLDYAPVEVLFKEYWRPGLFADIVAGKRPELPKKDLSKIDIRQPEVRFASVDGQASVEPGLGERVRLPIAISNRNAEIKIEVVDNPKPPSRSDHPALSGAKDVRLFRNGSLVKLWQGDIFDNQNGCDQQSTKPNEPRRAICKATVSLVAGDNNLTAYAFNHDDVKSTDAELVATGMESLRRADATTHILAIGINNYAGNPYFKNLRFAETDAEAFSKEMSSRQKALGRQTDLIEPLYSEAANKENILAALQKLASQVKPEDSVVIYFSGHGKATRDGRFYLIPTDIGYQTLDEVLQHSILDVELEKVFRSMDAGQILLIIDACNSGQALGEEDARRGPMNSQGLGQLAYEKGMYVLAAAQGYQAATELRELGHSLLTDVLLRDGLTTKADTAQPLGQITTRKWFDYAARAVPTRQREMIEQFKKQGKDFSFVDGLKGDGDPEQTPRVFYRREIDAHPFVVTELNLKP